MAVHISEFYNIPHSQFESLGVLDALYGIYVVVIVDGKQKTNMLDQLKDKEEKRNKDDMSVPEIIFVDAREKPTASKM